MYAMGFYATNRMASKMAKLGPDPNSANRAMRTEAEMDQLHLRIDKLALVVDAMWIMLERAGYSREDLEALLKELDESDASSDGGRAPAGSKCAKCGAMVEAGRPSCTFCGAAVSA